MQALKTTILAACMTVGLTQAAQAGSYSVDVYSADLGHGFDSVTSSAALFTSRSGSTPNSPIPAN